ncbi:ATP synthase subunit beta [Wickerhamomyces ciferrii]|uniref:ATP synthase subunit beta n=1 Tax=Wickerhamomyces ciferrii (strain ATCC 14091 / BCRC 22168 / CBS 111 / JCM 3599 / NBRC 0793 / NRRL Y-1031 F-60-10) TaxID=1206466 RepID=K0KJE5_WICCF|nr:ATP synthase subunit beta [Wickerhamomyces ciferrii]CCH41609.1 ATP synthase subunit beta [Wickerhamomyces ciferrii]
MAAARTSSSRGGSHEGQGLNRVPLNAHRQQLQREIDRIAGLLNTREVHADAILRSTFNDQGGAPSNTPEHSPKMLNGYNDSNYVTTPGVIDNKNKSKTMKPLKMQLLELKSNDDPNALYQQPYKKFLSINDLLTSENDSTFPGSSPLGDKTLEFINQTTMTGNHTMFLNTVQSPLDPNKKTSSANSGSHNMNGTETSNFLPMSVLDTNKPSNLQSSPNRNQYHMNLPYNNNNNRPKQPNLFDNINGGPSSNDGKQNWVNPFGLPDPKNELALSSSPLPNFETRFPEPKPIHELFDSVPVDSHLREEEEDDDEEEDDVNDNDNTVSEHESEDNGDDDDDYVYHQPNITNNQDIMNPVNSNLQQISSTSSSKPLPITKSNLKTKTQTKPKTKPQPKPKTKPKTKPQAKPQPKPQPRPQVHDNEPKSSNIASDTIDSQLKLEDQLQRMSKSTQEDSEELPNFEISSNIKNALRKRKKISYNLERINSSDDSPKTSRLKRRAKRQNIQPKTSHLHSSSPRKYKRTSSSGSNRSYRRKKSIQPRSKSGCWTCRIRKKKCTEERPSCEQCIKLGLICDGYSEERPHFMMNQQSQRQRLDEIKHHTSQRKKIGVKKVRIDE